MSQVQATDNSRAVENKPVEQPWRVLGPGRVLFNHGPTTMVVVADRDGEPITDTICKAFDVINDALTDISVSLPELKQPPGEIDRTRLTDLAKKMLDAVLAVGEPTLTPMASVAGAVADAVADWIFDQGASRVMVSNGGDVALRLAPGQSVKVGVVTSLATGKTDRVVTVCAEDGIGGICTSGLGGRSFTRGVADGVCVFSSRCIIADALATHIANCSYIESEAVAQMKAIHLEPHTDIPDLEVTVSVDKLSSKDVKQALKQVKEEAVRQKKKGNLIALCARVQDQLMDFQMPHDSGQ